MNKVQINKSRMYFACDLILDNHQAAIEPFAELGAAHQELKNQLALIGEYRQVQELDSKGLTINKTKLRLDLIRMIQRYSRVLMAHATLNKDANLKNKVDYSFSQLKKTADPILTDIGQLIFNLALPYKGEIERFGINQASFDAMETLLSAFRNAIPKKRIATGMSKVSTANINATFRKIDKLLNDQIDIYMRPLEYLHSDFYNEYISARIIVDYAGRPAASEEEVSV